MCLQGVLVKDSSESGIMTAATSVVFALLSLLDFLDHFLEGGTRKSEVLLLRATLSRVELLGKYLLSSFRLFFLLFFSELGFSLFDGQGDVHFWKLVQKLLVSSDAQRILLALFLRI